MFSLDIFPQTFFPFGCFFFGYFELYILASDIINSDTVWNVVVSCRKVIFILEFQKRVPINTILGGHNRKITDHSM